MTICSARTTCRPVSVSTSTVRPSRKRALPATSLTPARFMSPETPLVSRPTMSSFQAMVRASSIAGRAAVMPSGLAPAAIAVRRWNSSAAWISALDGMQPMVRQVPPGRARSTTTVSRPSWPARIAAT